MSLPAPRQGEASRARTLVPVALGLVVSIFLAYWPVVDAEFINYDDNRYVTENLHVQQGLSWGSVRWAFSTFDVANWHPLTWLSHMMDWQLFGSWAGGHHAVNLALHTLNAVLVLLLISQLTSSLWRSALVAALFGLHPLHVESVAWIAERKDVLSTMLGLLAIMAYLRHVQRLSRIAWLLSLLSFGLSLMAKPMLVTLPFVLVLLDLGPLRSGHKNLRVLRLFVAKWPYLVLAAASSIVTLMAQSRGEAVVSLEHVSLMTRLTNAIVSDAIYLWQTIWPVGLIPIYPYSGQWPIAVPVLAGFALLAITAASILRRSSNPVILTGWLWFLGTLVPVIGLVQVGVQAHADRYTYFPLIGVFMMIAWTLPLTGRLWPRVATALALLALIACGWLTHLQSQHWRDSESLFAHTLAVNEANATAHFNLGNVRSDQSRLDEAVAHYARAAELQPTWADPPGNIANIFARQGKFALAIDAYEQAIKLRPDAPVTAATLTNLAQVLISLDRPAEAVDRLNRAISLDPGLVDARVTLGNALADLGRGEDAIAQFDHARRLDADSLLPPLNKACVLISLHRIAAADAAFRIAVALDPQGILTHQNYANALAKAGYPSEARTHYQEARRHAEAAGLVDVVREIDRRLVQLDAASTTAPDR